MASTIKGAYKDRCHIIISQFALLVLKIITAFITMSDGRQVLKVYCHLTLILLLMEFRPGIPNFPVCTIKFRAFFLEFDMRF